MAKRRTNNAVSADTAPVLQEPELLRRLLRAKDHMDRAPQEDWSIRRLAEVGCVCEPHFARSFRQAFGVPPHRYLLTRRVERAMALLRDTELPITAIAFCTGWNSLGTFGRVFKDVTGQNPAAVRARTRDQAQMLAPVPACIVAAANRPDLQTSVSEKRRQGVPDNMAPVPTPCDKEQT